MASIASVQKTISQVQDQGYCVLRGHFPSRLVDACRDAFWPRLLAYLKSGQASNRGPHRHFLPMPFEPLCFSPQFFFDPDVLGTVRGLMDDRIVADQWGCDVPLRGSEYQKVHVDYQRPLFPEVPSLALPAYAVVVSFGLVRIAPEDGPIEIAPGTHRMTRIDALRAVEAGKIGLLAVPLEIGDVLIRHPSALHRARPIRLTRLAHWSRSAMSAAGMPTPAATWNTCHARRGSHCRRSNRPSCAFRSESEHHRGAPSLSDNDCAVRFQRILLPTGCQQVASDLHHGLLGG